MCLLHHGAATSPSPLLTFFLLPPVPFFLFRSPSLHCLSEYIGLPFAQIYGLGQRSVYLQSPDLKTYS